MFFERLNKMCAEHGLSVSAFLESLGIDRSAASRWKKGTDPSRPVQKKIADYFGITVNELMSGEISKKEKNSEESELSGVYLSYAKEAQQNGISPEDIKLAIDTIKRLRQK